MTETDKTTWTKLPTTKRVRKFMGFLVEKGDTVKTLADILGMSAATCYNRIHSGAFRDDEKEKIIEHYKLSPSKQKELFL